MFRKISLSLVASILLTLVGTSAASAATIEFSGQVDQFFGPFRTDPFGSEGELPSFDFAIGSPLSGRVVWDETATNDSNSDLDRGFYPGALTYLRIELGSQVWEIIGGDVDIFHLVLDPIQLTGIATGDSLGDFAPDYFAMDFDDPSGFIQSQAIPSSAPPFSSRIEPGSLSLNFVDGNGLTFEIEAFYDYTVVPEPTSAVLVAMGLIGLSRRTSH